MNEYSDTPPDPERSTPITRAVEWLGASAARLLRSPLLDGLPAHTRKPPRYQEARVLPPLVHPRRPRPALSLAELTAHHPILHTDDERTLLDLFNLVLVRAGLTVLRTLLGREALEICRQVPVSLVITDISKPDMSGVDLLRALQDDPATAHIPVMFVTAHPVRDAQEMLHMGAVGYYPKPMASAEFTRVVHDMLERYGNWHTPSHLDPAVSARLIAQYRALRPPR
jgi:CheY-like chemotaxis protein